MIIFQIHFQDNFSNSKTYLFNYLSKALETPQKVMKLEFSSPRPHSKPGRNHGITMVPMTIVPNSHQEG